MTRTQLFMFTTGAVLSLSLMAGGCGKPQPTGQPLPPSEPPQQEQAQPAEATTTQAQPVADQGPTSTAQAGPTTTAAKPAAKNTATAAPPKTPPTQQQVIANQTAPQTIYVTIKNGSFVPQVVSVKAGGTVIWTNKDTVAHTTRSDGSLLWDSGTLQPGASYRKTFKATGSYTYSCAAHPTAKGTVYVY